MLTFLRSTLSPHRLKILHEWWDHLKTKNLKNVAKLKFITSEDTVNNAEKIQFYSFSDLLSTHESSGPPRSVSHLEKGIMPLASQNAIANTLDCNLLQRPDFVQMLNHIFAHILYYLHPSFLSQQSVIVLNYKDANKKNFKWAFSKGILVVNVDLVFKDFNSLGFIINRNLNEFSSSFFEKEKERKKRLMESALISINEAARPSPSPSTNLKEYKRNHARTVTRMKLLLAKLLGLEEETAYSLIKKHPRRHYVPLEQILKTHFFLLENNYSIELIKDCPTILLYPKEKVEETLNFLHASNIIEKDFEKKYVLQLCVYYMEMPFHFSGEGVFPSEDPKKP